MNYRHIVVVSYPDILLFNHFVAVANIFSLPWVNTHGYSD